MSDALGWRKKFGVIIPSTNTIVQPDFASLVRLAAEAERWLGKPVIAHNTALYWHALRASGIDDRLDGFGSLLRDH